MATILRPRKILNPLPKKTLCILYIFEQEIEHTDLKFLDNAWHLKTALLVKREKYI